MGDHFRICHVNTRFLKGGGAKNTLLTIAGLDKARYEVDLIVGRDVYRPQVEAIDGVKLIVVKSMVRNIHPLLDLKALFELYGRMKARRYDLIHTHLSKAGLLGRLAARMAGVPIIVHSLHGPTFHGAQPPLVRCFYVLLERCLDRFTDSYVSVGEDLKNRYLEHRIGNPSKYVVIHSGMDLGKFFQASRLSEERIQDKKRELGLEKGDTLIGNVGVLEPRKGHIYAIEAAKKIVQWYPSVKFLFIGDGYHRPELEKRVHGCGLDNHIFFAGYREDIAEVMAVLDIVILTSVKEGLPQVLVQAAAMGIPIVTFDIEGAREIVRQNGFIVPLKGVEQLVERISYLLADLDRAREMGIKGRALIDDSWRVETMVKNTSTLYERLLCNHLAVPS